MTREELTKAEAMIAYGCERIEHCGDDSEGGWCLTAHWLDGGQKLFHTLEEVHRHCEERERASFTP
jgi:hypothetical protein